MLILPLGLHLINLFPSPPSLSLFFLFYIYLLPAVSSLTSSFSHKPLALYLNDLFYFHCHPIFLEKYSFDTCSLWVSPSFALSHFFFSLSVITTQSGDILICGKVAILCSQLSHFFIFNFPSFLSFLHPKSLSSSDLPLMFFHLLNLFILSSHIRHNPSHSPKHTHRTGINHFHWSYRRSSFKQTTFCTQYFSTSSIYQGNLNPLMH